MPVRFRWFNPVIRFHLIRYLALWALILPLAVRASGFVNSEMAEAARMLDRRAVSAIRMTNTVLMDAVLALGVATGYSLYVLRRGQSRVLLGNLGVTRRG